MLHAFGQRVAQRVVHFFVPGAPWISSRPAPWEFLAPRGTRYFFAPQLSQYVISRDGMRLAGLKSSPLKYATGSSAACVM
jgi:hypothetical protein